MKEPKYTYKTVLRIHDKINRYYFEHEDENIDDVNIYDFIPERYFDCDTVLNSLYDDVAIALGLMSEVHRGYYAAD